MALVTLFKADKVKTRDQANGRLLSRAQAGEIEAFAELFEQHRRFVFMIACRLAGANDCEDVVMDTFLKAWKALPRFNRRAALKTWLARIARNCALDCRRRAGRQAAREQTSTGASDEKMWERLPDAVADNPARQAVDRETGQLIETAMARLSEKQRITVIMREVDGLSYREIAAATDAGIGTVMSRLFYGKRKLRELLLEMYHEP